MSQQHLALYRKYRPETFDDVVGQEQAVQVLTSSIKQNKISHAYLFCGGRGTGKTTVARIFARDIGCNPEDIIEIDAASNRGIDDIRELRDAVRTSPFSSPYKVYIIDEAHMLTKEAANALLKTLEEPPSHVVFILATTDPDKLPQTIVSRCQKIIFKSPDVATLSKRLIHVTKKEGKSLSLPAAELVALHGNGSYRDALGVLEQIISVTGLAIEEEEVKAFVGKPEHAQLVSLLGAVCKKDVEAIFSTVKALSGMNAIKVYDDFLNLVRSALLARMGEEIADIEATKIGKEYPLIINSKLLLTLIEKRPLLLISDAHAFIALEAIILSLVEN